MKKPNEKKGLFALWEYVRTEAYRVNTSPAEILPYMLREFKREILYRDSLRREKIKKPSGQAKDCCRW